MQRIPPIVRLAAIVIAVTVAASVAIVVPSGAQASPAAASAVSAISVATPDPPCEWKPGQAGTDSTCDGLDVDRFLRNCAGFAVYPYEAIIRGPNGIALAKVVLGYIRGARTTAYPNGDCRVAYAYISVMHPDADCYAKVERNKDQQAFYVGGVYLPYPQTPANYTPVVYDAGVSSYAWGRCNYYGGTYDNGTPSY